MPENPFSWAATCVAEQTKNTDMPLVHTKKGIDEESVISPYGEDTRFKERGKVGAKKEKVVGSLCFAREKKKGGGEQASG